MRVSPGPLSEIYTRKAVVNRSARMDVGFPTIVSSVCGIDATLLDYKSIGALLSRLGEHGAISRLTADS